MAGSSATYSPAFITIAEGEIARDKLPAGQVITGNDRSHCPEELFTPSLPFTCATYNTAFTTTAPGPWTSVDTVRLRSR